MLQYPSFRLLIPLYRLKAQVLLKNNQRTEAIDVANSIADMAIASLITIEALLQEGDIQKGTTII